MELTYEEQALIKKLKSSDQYVAGSALDSLILPCVALILGPIIMLYPFSILIKLGNQIMSTSIWPIYAIIWLGFLILIAGAILILVREKRKEMRTLISILNKIPGEEH